MVVDDEDAANAGLEGSPVCFGRDLDGCEVGLDLGCGFCFPKEVNPNADRSGSASISSINSASTSASSVETMGSVGGGGVGIRNESDSDRVAVSGSA